MDRHLIALDMDGTLLNSENRVTERTQRTRGGPCVFFQKN